MSLIKNKSQFAWVMYDWANSAFATTVMAGFFPVFFKNYWSTTADVNISTAYLGMANSVASLIVALLAPILGAIADQGNKRKKFLLFFAYMSVLMTGCLFMVEMGNWRLAMFLYVMGMVGFSGANIFYDSLLPDVSSERNVDYISAKGYAYGYLGGGLLFLINVLWYTSPAFFGFDIEYSGKVIEHRNSGNQTELTIENFDLPEINDIKAKLIGKNFYNITKIDEIRQENEKIVKISLDENLMTDFAKVSSMVEYGKYKKAEISNQKGKIIELKNLTRKISPSDKITLTSDYQITIKKQHEGKYLIEPAITDKFDEIIITTDRLVPAKEYLPIRLSFLSVALWWAIFTIPLIMWIKEKKHTKEGDTGHYIRKGFGQLVETFRKIKYMKNIFIFLAAYWMYIDGVNTVMRMAVDYGMSIGLPSSSLIIALLITQFVGFPSALFFGKLGEKWSVKKALFIGIFVYLAINFWAVFMQEAWEFYLMAIVIGFVQGGIQALSRSLYSRLIPQNQSAEYFGFLNMTGKFAAIFGPALVGIINITARSIGFDQNLSTRVGIGSISLLFIGGAILLYFVKVRNDDLITENVSK